MRLRGSEERNGRLGPAGVPIGLAGALTVTPEVVLVCSGAVIVLPGVVIVPPGVVIVFPWVAAPETQFA